MRLIFVLALSLFALGGAAETASAVCTPEDTPVVGRQCFGLQQFMEGRVNGEILVTASS